MEIHISHVEFTCLTSLSNNQSTTMLHTKQHSTAQHSTKHNNVYALSNTGV
jgi:hypothetical protein